MKTGDRPSICDMGKYNKLLKNSWKNLKRFFFYNSQINSIYRTVAFAGGNVKLRWLIVTILSGPAQK